MQAPSLVAFSAGRGQSVFSILSSIGVTESAQLKRELHAYLRVNKNPEVHFRLERVYHLDSSGLGLFVSLQNEFRSTRFRFSGLRPNVRMVFEFSNLLSYFNIDQEEPAAEPRPPLPPPAAVEKPASGESLAIEGKYILTEEGVNYCAQRQIPVKELRLYKGGLVSGFTWSKVSTDLLERFVTHGLLAGMEIERTEFLDKREQILRLTEVVFDGIIMKRFRPMLKLQLMEDPSYRKLVGRGVPPEQLKAAVKQRKPLIDQRKAEIKALLAQRIGGELRPQMARLLGLVDDSVWFLLTEEPEGGGPLRRRILDALISYSGRLQLSESIALNLMEFLQQAEKAHFLNLAERDPFTRKKPEAIPELLADPQFRERLIAKAKLQNELLVVNMNFDGNPHNGRGGLVAEIAVRNKGKRDLPRDLMIEDFEAELKDLSLLNLAALKEICQKQGIEMETKLVKDDRSDETVASMKLTL